MTQSDHLWWRSRQAGAPQADIPANDFERDIWDDLYLTKFDSRSAAPPQPQLREKVGRGLVPLRLRPTPRFHDMTDGFQIAVEALACTAFFGCLVWFLCAVSS